MVNSRKIAVDILTEILYKKSYSNIALNKHFTKLGNEIKVIDKNFITQIVYGTIKNLYKIDYIINLFSKIKVKKMKPLVASVLRISVFQIFFLDKVPDSAICNEAVNIVKKSKLKNLSSFVNGVLRTIIRNKNKIEYPDKVKEPIDYLTISYSFPRWIIELWLNYYKFEIVEQMCRKLNETPYLNIRCNTLKYETDKLYKELIDEGYSVERGKYINECLKIKNSSNVKKLPGYNEGLFQVQDESSMFVAYALSPNKNSKVLDACSAPGGKSMHIAQYMQNSGNIISRDIHEHKLKLINDNCKRLGITNIKVELHDALQVDEKLIENIDCLLLDVPCSGLGILSKKPDIKLNKSDENMNELVKLQRNILKVCSNYVKKGGTLVYSTCTINPKENIENVNWFINNFSFELESLKNHLPHNFDCDTINDGYVQILPNEHDMDGFFIARMKRK